MKLVKGKTLAALLGERADPAAAPALQIAEPHRRWPQAVAAAVEPDDGWGRQFRAAREEKDRAKRRAALERLAERANLASPEPRRCPGRKALSLSQPIPG